ncbi:MAG: helix-turn-helix domain-containing protein [Polyangiaceae bacterium]
MLPKLDPHTRRAAIEIGLRIQAAREAAALSQETLATKIGMTRGNYSRIEQGRTNVTLDTLLRIARGLRLRWTFSLGGPGRDRPDGRRIRGE